MNITFHECRYILHLKDYDSGVFFYREVLGLQPNYKIGRASCRERV